MNATGSPSPSAVVDRWLSDTPDTAREGLDVLTNLADPDRRALLADRLDAIVDAVATTRTRAVQYHIAGLVNLASAAPTEVADALLQRARSTEKDAETFKHLTLAAGRVCVNHETRQTELAALLIDNLEDPERDGLAAMHLDELTEYEPGAVLEAWRHHLAEHGWPDRR